MQQAYNFCINSCYWQTTAKQTILFLHNIPFFHCWKNVEWMNWQIELKILLFAYKKMKDWNEELKFIIFHQSIFTSENNHFKRPYDKLEENFRSSGWNRLFKLFSTLWFLYRAVQGKESTSFYLLFGTGSEIAWTCRICFWGGHILKLCT